MTNLTQPKQAAEITAAVKNLGAEQADIAQLLVFIQEKNAALQQVSSLLRQAHNRLQILRGNTAELKQLTAQDKETAELIGQVSSSIQTENTWSFNEALAALQTAHEHWAKRDEAEASAMIKGLQALIAAVKQDYREAEKYYAQAAGSNGLSAALQWQYQIDRALTLEDLGREFGDKAALEQAISLLQNEILDLAPVEDKPTEWAITQHLLGNVLGVLGQRQGGTRYLENSIAAFEASLTKLNRQQMPLQWASTQNSLGNSLGILAHRQNDLEMLGQSADAFEKALEERTRDKAPQDWATTQNNLAAIFQSVGQRNKDAKLLKKSVDAYKEVLQEWTRERVPLDWATTMNNLATALRLLGEHRKGPRTLEQSVAAYNSALAERTRERVPQDWAMTQNNLGAALQKLSEREDDPEVLERAIASYQNALKEWTKERAPMAWAMTMANLGVARRTLAERTSDVGFARMAVEELEAVSEAFREASHAHYSELSIDELEKARKLASGLAGI